MYKKFKSQPLNNNENNLNTINAMTIMTDEHATTVSKADFDALSQKVDKMQKEQLKQTVLLEQILKVRRAEHIFPIKSEEKLAEIDADIDEDQNKYMMALNKIIQGKPLSKEFAKILDEKVAYKFNFDGTKGKQPFKNYKHLNNILFECTKKEGTNLKEFEDEVRRSFKLLKGRVNKRNSKNRSTEQ